MNGDIRAVVETNLTNRRGISRSFVWDDHAPQVARVGARRSREILSENLQEGDTCVLCNAEYYNFAHHCGTRVSWLSVLFADSVLTRTGDENIP